MVWINFPAYAIASSIFWTIAIVLLYTRKFTLKKELLAKVSVLLGVGIFLVFMVQLWLTLERPPLRTLGETRLWYAFFLPIIGFVSYLRWRYKWLLAYSLSMAMLFFTINYLNPDTYNKALMPALQSPWFVPHVVVYIFAYAMLAASSLVAIRGLWSYYQGRYQASILPLADNIVYLGFAFLTFGLLFGALWAKEAWGHYWTWDPKETWAFITWLGYLIYLHLRIHSPLRIKAPLWMLTLAFVLLLLCWFGVNYLPSTQTSIHTYGMNQ